MNAILLGAASLGALLVTLATAPDQLVINQAAQYAADDAEVARLMEAAPDAGELDANVMIDPETGEATEVTVLAFRE